MTRSIVLGSVLATGLLSTMLAANHAQQAQPKLANLP
jgi:hypothetical protein